MSRRRLSFMEKRRARLRMQVERLEMLETKQTITEPISILGLSAGITSGLSFLNPLGTNRPDVAAQGRRDSSRSAKQVPGVSTRPRAGNPFAIRLRAVITSAGSDPSGEGSPQTVAPRKAVTDPWLTATSRERRTPTDTPKGSPLASRSNPAPRSAGGGVQSVSRGGAPGNLATRGAVTPLRFPSPGDQTAPIPGALGSPSFAGAGNASISTASSRAASVPSVNARAAAATPTAKDPPISSNPAPMIAALGSSGGTPIDVVTDTSPLAGFSHFPLYVFDYNYGSILIPGFYQYAVIGGPSEGWVDLRAQVRDTTASTYSWDTTGLTQATNITGTNTYRLQFKWGTTSTPQANSVTLTVTDNLGQQEVQTLTFWVPTGTSTVNGGAPTVTWPSTLPPDTVVPGAPAFDSHYVDVEANTGALETALTLPTYNPNIPPVVLEYDSLAVDPRPLIVVHHEVSSSLAIPNKTSVQLTFNGSAGTTYYYATSAFNPGDYAQFAVQADATGLATNRYSYSTQVIDYRTTNTTATYSGTATVVSPTDNPFGAIGQGWSIQGLNRIISATGGVILDTGSNDRLWFATAGTIGGTTSYTSPAGDFTTLTKNGTYSRLLPDGTKQEFDSSGYQTAAVDRNNLRITFTYDGSRKLTNISDPYGKSVTLAYDGSNKLQTVTDPAGRVVTVTHSGNTLTGATMPDQSAWAYVYDGSGRITKVTDPRSKVVSIVYSASNRAGTITRPDATTQTFTAYQERGYDTSGTSGSPAAALLLAEARASGTDPRGFTTDLRTDWRGLGLVEQMTDPDLYIATADRDANGLATITIDRLNRISRDTYDSKGNILTNTYADLNTYSFTYNSFSEPLSDTNPRGYTTSFLYDANGNATVVWDAANNRTTMAYTANGRLQTVKDARNKVTTNQYDTQDRLTTITHPDGTTTKFAYDSKGNAVTVTDERGNATKYAFDAMNRQLGSTDALGNRVTNVYDSGGNLTQVQAPLSRTTNYAYDSMNRVTTLTDPLSHNTVFGFDASGNRQTVKDALNRVTTSIFDSQNRRTVLTDAAGKSVTTVFDAEGQATQVTDRLGRITSTAYSSRGWVATVTDPLGKTTTYSYTATGKTTSETDPSSGGAPALFNIGYDALDRQVTFTDALGHTVTTVYDAVGNKIATVDANSNRTTYAYDIITRLTTLTDPLSHNTVYGFDQASNRQTITDSLGHTATTLYDALNRATTIVDALTGTTTMAFDGAGRRTGLTDSVGNRTTWSYNAGDLMTTMVDALGTATYVYNNANELTDQTDRAGRRVTFAYDNDGRRTGEQWFGTGARLITATYDAEGQLTGVKDPDATLTFTYDSGGNLATAVTSGPGTGQPTVTLTYGYNATHDRTSVTDSLSSVGRITTTYDAAHRVVSLQQSFGASAGPYVDFQYDAANRLTTVVRAIGAGAMTTVRSVQNYDNASRITTQTHSKVVTSGLGPGETVTPLATFVYGYDAGDRLTTQVDAEGTAAISYGITDQLTTVTGSRSETYGYDANGNRNTTGYTVISGNRYSSGGGYTFTYDAEGNQTGKRETSTGNAWTYAYDHHNRLTVATEKNSGGTTIMQATYTYDALGRRIGTKVDDDGSGAHAAVQTWMVYDGSDTDANTYADFNGSGTLLTRYLFAPAIDALLARTSSGGTTAWYLPDKLGSIRDIVNTSGTMIDHIVYNSFGGVTPEINSANGDRFKFTRREYDLTTGIYFYRARYYDPMMGRFMRQDPLGFGAGDNNLYRYVGNGPTNNADPSGLIDASITSITGTFKTVATPLPGLPGAVSTFMDLDIWGKFTLAANPLESVVGPASWDLKDAATNAPLASGVLTFYSPYDLIPSYRSAWEAQPKFNLTGSATPKSAILTISISYTQGYSTWPAGSLWGTSTGWFGWWGVVYYGPYTFSKSFLINQQ